MTLGQKIKKLRVEKGLTQKSLADSVNVTFQTVSKWENDENEPDVSTLRRLANLFDCSMDYLLSEDESKSSKEESEEQSKVVIIHQKEMHVCEHCGKDIPEDELKVVQLYRTIRRGRSHHQESNGQAYYHKSCYEEVEKQRAEQEKASKAARAIRCKKKCFGWSIPIGAVALAIALAVLLTQTAVHPALCVLYSVLIGYAIFSAAYCIFSGSYIGDVFVWCSSLSIKFPGLIFSWSIDGFAWLIAMKILFAILGFLIGILAFAFGVAMAGSLGAISFPFVLIHNIHTQYEDSLFD